MALTELGRFDEAIAQAEEAAQIAETWVSTAIVRASPGSPSAWRTRAAATGRGGPRCSTAVSTNDSAVRVLGDEILRGIARELVATVRANVTIDWIQRENVRARLRVLVRRILRKHGYPPDKQEQATRTVLEQAELLSEHWALAA